MIFAKVMRQIIKVEKPVVAASNKREMQFALRNNNI